MKLSETSLRKKMARHPGGPWCKECSERPFRRSKPIGHGRSLCLRNKSEFLEKSETLDIPGRSWWCHGSHFEYFPDEKESEFLTKNPEKKSKSNENFILEKENKFCWEQESSSSDDETNDWTPAESWPKLTKIKSSRRQKEMIKNYSALKPCELDNPHIDWEPPTTTNENWDIIDVSIQDTEWFFPYEGQFEDFDDEDCSTDNLDLEKLDKKVDNSTADEIGVGFHENHEETLGGGNDELETTLSGINFTEKFQSVIIKAR